MCRPRRDGAAALLLAGNLLFPVAAWAVGGLAALPAGAPVDWAGVSWPARVLDALLVAQLGYAAGLVAVMRGRRGVAESVGVAAVGVSVAVNMWAWLAVTRVYV